MFMSPMTNQIDHGKVAVSGTEIYHGLFTEFACFAQDHMLEQICDLILTLTNEHPLDRLDKLISGQIELSEKERANKIKAIMMDLKANKPEVFNEAWNHPNPKIRKRWRDAIMNKLKSMVDRRVWKKIKKKVMPKGRKCIKYKWIFDIKRDGRF